MPLFDVTNFKHGSPEAQCWSFRALNRAQLAQLIEEHVKPAPDDAVLVVEVPERAGFAHPWAAA